MGEDAAHERSRARPPGGIHFEPRVSAVSEKARDRDVGDADVAEQEAFGRQLALEIVEGGGNIFFQRLADALLVGRLAPHQRAYDLLVEERPDEEVAEPRVCELIEPA